MESGDWRAQLHADSRERIVNKIMETLKRHLPFSGHEGLQELKKIAMRFEDKIYTSATSQSDYLRKISVRMLTMEARSQNTMPSTRQPNSAANIEDQVMQQAKQQMQQAKQQAQQAKQQAQQVMLQAKRLAMQQQANNLGHLQMMSQSMPKNIGRKRIKAFHHA